MNIVLFGFMGTGKSAVAQVLARRMNLRWVDMDREIETQQGMSVEKIFEKHGEKFFREQERFLVQELIKQDGLVVSTGGGVVLDEANIRDFLAWGCCICLNANSQVIFERTRHRQDRPLLKDKDPMMKIQELLKSRESYYLKIPIQIDTSDRSLHDVIGTILHLLDEHEKIKN